MPGPLKALLWTAAAAGVAVAVVVGFGVFRLSQIFPDADEGRSIGEQIERELVADHPGVSVTSHAEASFAEVSVTITPSGGEFREPEVSDLLATLQDLVAEHADSRWSIDTTFEGRWGTSPVTIHGSDAARWPELSPVLDLADNSRVAVSVHLDARRAGLHRDLDTDRLCGTGTTARNFFADTVEEASTALTELQWTSPGDPGLFYQGSGCAGPLRTSLTLSGPERLGRIEDLRTLLSSLPDEAELVGITVQDTGKLEVALEDDPTDPVRESVVHAWSHGEVWINGTRATGS